MTEQLNARPEYLPQVDLIFSKNPHHTIEIPVHSRDVLARTIGTPEHAALVAAVKRNFPEIYEDGPGSRIDE